MQNANGSLTANLSNRRVRGSKPAETSSTSSSSDARAAGLERRQAAIDARRARVADGTKTPIFNGKKTRASQGVADELGDGDDGGKPQSALKTKSQKVAAIAEVLREGIDDDGALDDAADRDTGDVEQPDDSDRENGKPEPITLEALAETYGAEVADLYELIEIPDRDGKAHTLGELKDLLQEHVDLDALKLEFSERKSSDENELMRRRQELDFILQSLPKTAITPEIKTRATAELQRVVKLEAQRTLEAIPDWRKEETRKRERAAIGDWMTGFGFDAGAVDRVVDHRMVKLLRDSWQRHEAVKAALAKVKEQKGDTGTRRPARTNGARRPNAPKLGPNPTRTQKVAAISHLLREGL